MRLADFNRSALLVCAALAVLAGCGAQSQTATMPPPGTTIVPQGRVIRYSVSALTTPLGGGVAEGISNRDWVVGSTNGQSGCCRERAALWRDGEFTDLGTLGGRNSSEQWPVKDDRGLIAIVAETSKRDPLQENFCGFGTALTCLGALWEDGVLRALPTLGGNNGSAFAVNDLGQVAGYAETSKKDSSCPTPHVLDFQGVVWGPNRGETHQLRHLAGDTVGGADGINDRQQVIGVSGICSNPSRHGVLWYHGTITDLGNLGGVLNTFPWAINSRGDVVGQSDLPGDTTNDAFLWTKAKGMQNLGTLPGDGASLAFGTNSRLQIVGGSCIDVSYNNCRAFLWQDGTMVDMNDLVCSATSLHLFFGNDINDRGTIVGYAFDKSTHKYRPFIAVPRIVASRSKTC